MNTLPTDLDRQSPQQLMALWRTLHADMRPDDPALQEKFAARKTLSRYMQKRKIFPTTQTPSGGSADIFADMGLYPDTDDPNFIYRLLNKTEFADTASPPLDADTNPCESKEGFEVTPVQRFVANFMHPRTPYMSMLLYHGVGVGKTCAAIQAAEAYLDVFANRKIIIVAPPTIQEGFKRTIFDMTRLTIGKGAAPNTQDGCTGDTYLKLTGCLYERDTDVIRRRVRRAMNRRYQFMGYVQLRNYIRKTVQSVPEIGTEFEKYQMEALRREFGYRMLIIDEAHNLRDVKGTEGGEEEEKDSDAAQLEDAKQGKLLTPFLLRLLRASTGTMKLLLMTATPMFNSVREIVFLLNLLRMNDRKIEIQESDLLTKDGDVQQTELAKQLFQQTANAYISFMRGENPISFPLRLSPMGGFKRLTQENYPPKLLGTGKPVPEEAKERLARLPIVLSEFPEEAPAFDIFLTYHYDVVEEKKGDLDVRRRDLLMQAGNCTFPISPVNSESGSQSNSPVSENSADDESADVSEDLKNHFGVRGFENCFERFKGGQVRVRKGIDTAWLSQDRLPNYSPKFATCLRALQKAEGVCFVYSRFVTVGAFLMALILEANGYTNWDPKKPKFLLDGIQSPGGKQCAVCPKRQDAHTGAEGHAFVPAKYILLTGDTELSPNVAACVNAARSDANKDGGIVKVVLGSQIASEGLDLRFIRENHILDAWFHLNKTEQIIGRAIRFCSHTILPVEKRNTTVYLHALSFQKDIDDNETVDIAMYRDAASKAAKVGAVSRLLKVNAVDCNLRKEAAVIRPGLLSDIVLRDSQGAERREPRHDTPFTAMCDWMEECDYRCQTPISIQLPVSDDATYDAFGARYRESQIKKVIQAAFQRQQHYSETDLLGLFAAIQATRTAIELVLRSIVNNRQFKITVNGQSGYIVYRNRYYVFQPDVYADLGIPLAIRALDFPVKRDEFTPEKYAPQVLIEPAVVTQIKTGFWSVVSTWIDAVIRTRGKEELSSDLKSELSKLTAEDRKQNEVYKEKLGILRYLASLVSPDDLPLLRQAYLEYIWDEWLTIADQQTLLREGAATPAELQQVAEEQLMIRGSIVAVRYVNPDTGFLEFMCGEKQCDSLLSQTLRDDPEDPLKQRKADLRSAAGDVVVRSYVKNKNKQVNTVESVVPAHYGYIVPKNGILVFKTQPAHPTTGKPDRGQECAIVSTRGPTQEKLVVLGAALLSTGNNLSLERGALQKNPYLPNANTGCTFLDVVLRFMDKKRVLGKRWFFRPVAAFYSKHVGKTTKGTAAAIEAAQMAALGQVKAPARRGRPPKEKPIPVPKPVKPVVAPELIPKTKRIIRKTAAPVAAPAVPEAPVATEAPPAVPEVPPVVPEAPVAPPVETTKRKIVRKTAVAAPAVPVVAPVPAAGIGLGMTAEQKRAEEAIIANEIRRGIRPLNRANRTPTPPLALPPPSSPQADIPTNEEMIQEFETEYPGKGAQVFAHVKQLRDQGWIPQSEEELKEVLDAFITTLDREEAPVAPEEAPAAPAALMDPEIQRLVDMYPATLQPISQRTTDLPLPQTLYAPVWEQSKEAFQATLAYINRFKFRVYILFVENNTFKAFVQYHPAGNPEGYKERVPQILHESLPAAYREMVTGDNATLMGCVIQVYSPSTTPNEYQGILQTLLSSRQISDGAYIFSLRDATILHKRGAHPLLELMGGETPIVAPSRVVPIFNTTGHVDFWDIPIFTYEDTAFLKDSSQYATVNRTWATKQSKAVFRGSATGCGWMPETNARIQLALLGQDPAWKDILDAGLTAGASKPKIDPLFGLGIFEPKKLKLSFVSKMSKQEQSNFKYILYVAGNVAAHRLATDLLLGSVILRVETPYRMWCEEYMVENEHYLSVKADLSNLREVITWCLANDAECERIAANGVALAQRLLTQPTLYGLLGDELNSVGTGVAPAVAKAPSPKAPTPLPKTPSPKATSPKVPSPKAPSPKAPTPLPKEPTPAEPEGETLEVKPSEILTPTSTYCLGILEAGFGNKIYLLAAYLSEFERLKGLYPQLTTLILVHQRSHHEKGGLDEKLNVVFPNLKTYPGLQFTTWTEFDKKKPGAFKIFEPSFQFTYQTLLQMRETLKPYMRVADKFRGVADDFDVENGIAVHIRMGDKFLQNHYSLKHGSTSRYLLMAGAYYRDMIDGLRGEVVEEDAPIYIFTDSPTFVKCMLGDDFPEAEYVDTNFVQTFFLFTQFKTLILGESTLSAAAVYFNENEDVTAIAPNAHIDYEFTKDLSKMPATLMDDETFQLIEIDDESYLLETKQDYDALLKQCGKVNIRGA